MTQGQNRKPRDPLEPPPYSYQCLARIVRNLHNVRTSTVHCNKSLQLFIQSTVLLDAGLRKQETQEIGLGKELRGRDGQEQKFLVATVLSLGKLSLVVASCHFTLQMYETASVECKTMLSILPTTIACGFLKDDACSSLSWAAEQKSSRYEQQSSSH